MKLKVMSFNVQHCKNFLSKKIDYSPIIELINKYNPDIVALNEVYGKGYDKSINYGQAEYIAKNIGYFYYFGKSTRIKYHSYGNAILSKYPLSFTRTIKIPFKLIKSGRKYYERRSIIEADVLINNKIFNVYVTHLGLNEDEQVNGINTLLKNISKENTIILGDFNVVPTNKVLYNLYKCVNDTAVKLKGNMFSWPADEPKYKFDYIFVSKEISIIYSKILKEIISDHLPYITNLKI